MNKDKLRSEFEQLPRIALLIKWKKVFYNKHHNSYGVVGDDYDLGYINGAWYVYQELNK